MKHLFNLSIRPIVTNKNRTPLVIQLALVDNSALAEIAIRAYLECLVPPDQVHPNNGSVIPALSQIFKNTIATVDEPMEIPVALAIWKPSTGVWMYEQFVVIVDVLAQYTTAEEVANQFV